MPSLRPARASIAEPPCTDPYARWCGRGRRVQPPPLCRSIKGDPMKSLGISILGLLGLCLVWWAQAPRVVSAQTKKPFMITRLYTGQDGQTHAEEFEAKFTEKD